MATELSADLLFTAAMSAGERLIDAQAIEEDLVRRCAAQPDLQEELRAARGRTEQASIQYFRAIQDHRDALAAAYGNVLPAEPATIERQIRGEPASPLAKPPSVERRSRPRCPVRYEAVIHAADGTDSRWKVRGIDIDDAGAQVIAPGPVAYGVMVYFYLPSSHQMGFAFVRHCARAGDSVEKYRIGLQFRGRLMDLGPGTWQVSLARESHKTQQT